MNKSLAQLLPLIFFYTFLALPDETYACSLQPFGRFVSILVILFYTLLDVKYGIMVCILVIYYYQMEFLEKCCELDSCMLTGRLYTENFINQESTNITNFREEQCKDGQLQFKNKPVKNENAPHIFPNMSFTDKPCNPCDKKCGISIDARLSSEEELSFPKLSSDWVLKIWNTWFSEDYRPPYAHSSMSSSPSTLM